MFQIKLNIISSIFFTLLVVSIVTIVHSTGCNIVQSRDFINDGINTKFDYSGYKMLDSLTDSFNCDTLITLERTGCLGKCPVFKLALLSNGSVYFQGRYHVARNGIYDTLYKRSELKKLVSAVYKSGFFKLRDKYDLSNCVGPTDLSSISISLTIPDSGKKVSFYIGCMEYPAEGRLMSKLAERIERISNVESWIR